MKKFILLAVVVSAFVLTGCKKKKADDGTGSAGSAEMTGSAAGSAMAGSDTGSAAGSATKTETKTETKTKTEKKK